MTESYELPRDAEFEMIKMVTDSLSIGLCYVLNREFLWTNQFMLNLTGYTQGELLGSKTRRIYESDEEYTRIEKELKKSKAGVIAKIVKKNGERKNVMIHAISDEVPTDEFKRPLVKTFSVLPDDIMILVTKNGSV